MPRNFESGPSLPHYFEGAGEGIRDSAKHTYAITPHNTNELPVYTRGIYVGTGGTVVVRGISDTVSTTWVNVPSGFVMPVQAKIVEATGTTASNLIGLY